MTMTKEYQKKKEQRNTFLEVYVVIGVGIGKKKNGRNELVLNNNVSIKMQKKGQKSTLEQFALSSVSVLAAKEKLRITWE